MDDAIGHGGGSVGRTPFAPDDVDVESALERVQGAATSVVHEGGLSRGFHIARALRGLEAALRDRAHVLEDVIEPQRMSTWVLGQLAGVCRSIEELAGHAEVLAARAGAGMDAGALRVAVDQLVRDVRAALGRETQVVLDAYWVDVGVGD